MLRLENRLRNLLSVLLCLILLPLLSGCVAVFDKLPHKKWGFIDKSGRLVIPYKFDDVARDQHGGWTLPHKTFVNFSQGLCAVRVGNKWGYIDKNGLWKVPLKYDSAGNFSDGLALVRVADRYGYIDKSGREVIPASFDIARIEGAKNDNPDWDFTQTLLTPLEFSEGLAVACRDGKFGYIDKTGKFVIEPVYMRAEPFRQGLAAVNPFPAPAAVGGRTFIDKSGKVVAPASQNCIDFSEGVFLAGNGRYDSGRRLFYLSEAGARITSEEFEDARIFSEGLAAVAPKFDSANENKAYGYVDKSGKIVIKPGFDISGNNLAGNFRHGRAVVSRTVEDALGNRSNLHGIVDTSGRFLVKPSYSHISSYCDGLARALIDNHTVYLDMNGKVAIETRSVWGNSFSEGLAAVMEP